MKAKHQRLILALVALVAIIGAGLLISRGLREQAAYFYTPAEARAATIEPGVAARLGGMGRRALSFFNRPNHSPPAQRILAVMIST